MKKMSKIYLARILMVIGLMAVGYTVGQIEPAHVFGNDSYSVHARFLSVDGLETGNPVKMLGIKIGQVEGLSMDQDNQFALAQLRIDSNIDIFDDAIASIKMQGLIGKNYVSIDPGGSKTVLAPGEIITETEPLFDIAGFLGKQVFRTQTDNSCR